MQINRITGQDYIAMVRQGAARLNAKRKVINDLNVFPIPDGDTGDNMYMTINSGCSNAQAGSLAFAASSVAKGMLLGARGNSGVILSRIFAGISKGLEGLESAGVEQFAAAMHSGVTEAYNAVSTPVEGTILTVIRESVEKAKGLNFEEYFQMLVCEMKESLNRTPELLAVLREARVVDSGGAGMLCIAEGMLDAILAAQKGLNVGAEPAEGPAEPAQAKAPAANLDDFGPESVLEFGYCTEFLLRLQTAKVGAVDSFDESVIRDWLNAVGESVVCFRDGSIVKVHVHTMDPGAILTKAREWGEFLTLKIENMTLQHSKVTIQDNFSAAPAADEDEFRTAPKPYGSVAVASGRGLVQAFKDAGVDEIIEGGQTMNPSAAAFLDAFDKVHAQTVFVFPNNSNIIMTAQQAAEMYQEKHPERRVVVFATRNVGAGYVAAASMDCSGNDTDAIIASVNSQIASVVAGHISRAIRDSQMDGVAVQEGEWIGISGGKIVAASQDRSSLAVDLTRLIGAGMHEVALVFSGAGVPPTEAAALSRTLQAKFPRTEIIMTDGGQPVYDYIIVLC